ncbi:hypothetical protein L596_010012 [Steinernema carpocapsae]|uniref:Uncharacterized protein n=1 Tax=Steinernema carpocapsae TaxID=34508 RepID=A0A4U5PH12_STECR|nr:hypothetical protein L596_010012 [Steinernema carpocapsae]
MRESLRTSSERYFAYLSISLKSMQNPPTSKIAKNARNVSTAADLVSLLCSRSAEISFISPPPARSPPRQMEGEDSGGSSRGRSEANIWIFASSRQIRSRCLFRIPCESPPRSEDAETLFLS